MPSAAGVDSLLRPRIASQDLMSPPSQAIWKQFQAALRVTPLLSSTYPCPPAARAASLPGRRAGSDPGAEGIVGGEGRDPPGARSRPGLRARTRAAQLFGPLLVRRNGTRPRPGSSRRARPPLSTSPRQERFRRERCRGSELADEQVAEIAGRRARPPVLHICSRRDSAAGRVGPPAPPRARARVHRRRSRRIFPLQPAEERRARAGKR